MNDAQTPLDPASRTLKTRKRKRLRDRKRPTLDWGPEVIPTVADATSGIRTGLKLLDEALRLVERTAWDCRAVAEHASEAWEEATSLVGSPPRDAPGGDSPRQSPLRLQRTAATAWMLLRVVAGYRAHSILAAFQSQTAAADSLERLHADSARRFREASAVHGGAFLKIGQILSARQDL